MLTDIPAEVGQLSALQAGTWHRNRITHLPEEIGGLTSLRDFAVYHNKLRALPKSIGQLRNCIELWAYGNEITELPNEIGDMCSLRCASVADSDSAWLLQKIFPAASSSMHQCACAHRRTLRDMAHNLGLRCQCSHSSIDAFCMQEALAGRQSAASAA